MLWDVICELMNNFCLVQYIICFLHQKKKGNIFLFLKFISSSYIKLFFDFEKYYSIEENSCETFKILRFYGKKKSRVLITHGT